MDGCDRRRDPPPPRGGQLRRRHRPGHGQAGAAMTAPAVAAPAAGRASAPALPGRAYPLGATVSDDGTNFAVAAGAADGMLLCLFYGEGAERQIPLADYDAGVWHGFVPGVGAGQAY